jgi:hypothetical protein
MVLKHGLTVFALLPELQVRRIEMERPEVESPLFVRPGSADPANLDSVRPSPHLSPRPSPATRLAPSVNS